MSLGRIACQAHRHCAPIIDKHIPSLPAAVTAGRREPGAVVVIWMAQRAPKLITSLTAAATNNQKAQEGEDELRRTSLFRCK